MAVYLGNNPVSVYNGGQPIIVESGQYAWERYEVAPDPCLSFVGNEEFTLKTNNTAINWDGILEYSTDAITWSTWNGTEISSSGNKLYLRGTGNSKITDYITNESPGARAFVFTGTDTLRISCEGNIEYLLDYETIISGNHPVMSNQCYSYMFYGCTSLTTAPELPAITLSDNCYRGMFYNCANLTTAPQLPAATLAYACYQYMFYNCTSLTITPSLPATTLTDGCYRGMFAGCTSLTTAPELPANTLTSSCYNIMFAKCTSLTTAPQLPATTLAYGCYSSMFQDCTNLVAIPQLPATTLAESCYYQMFINCSNIRLSETQTGDYQTVYRIPTSGTGTKNSNSLSGTFSGTGGTFRGDPTINTTYYTSNTIV